MAGICVVNGSCDWQHSKVIRHILTHPPPGLRVCAIVADFSSVLIDSSIILGLLVNCVDSME
jgi:anti-anti-sigma regulatory factor